MMINIVFTAHELVSRGGGFGNSEDVTTFITGDIAAELADVLLASLGNVYESLNSEDATAISDLNEAMLCVAVRSNAVMVPETPGSVAMQQEPCLPLQFEAFRDEATRSPVASVQSVSMKKIALFSLEDDLSLNETPHRKGALPRLRFPLTLTSSSDAPLADT